MKDQSSKQQPSNPANNQPKPTSAQELASLRQQYNAVSELLWETIRTLAPQTHEVTVLPRASNPLWEICFVRAEGKDGKPDETGRMRICAALIPEMTEAEKKRVVRFLRGTSRPLEDALAEFQLPHPISYVEAKIADRIKWTTAAVTSDTKTHPAGIRQEWTSVTPAEIGEKVKNAIHWPK